MRVIAGEYKGRRLKAVPGQETRPTSDKIKEAVFHRMGPFFEGGKALDLFAGSGSLGIEALSRGMDHVVFVDRSAQAIKTIHQNIAMLKSQKHTEVYRNDALRALDTAAKKQEQFSLILLDPPYDKGLYQKMMDKITSAGLLKEEGFLYVEHRPELPLIFAEEMDPVFERQYNSTTQATILKKE